MATWFEGSDRIECDLAHVLEEAAEPGRLFAGVVGRMPGMTSADLVDQEPGTVVIVTNEGRMSRTGITVTDGSDGVVIDYDEEYQAGSKVTATSHFHHRFSSGDRGVDHTMVISGVEASGVLGFFYRKLGSGSMGKAFLSAWKDHLEQPSEAS